MKIQFIGKFYDNHSLSIVNRNIALGLQKLGHSVNIISLDSYNPVYNIDKKQVRKLKELEIEETDYVPEIQIRHSYPPVWNWPEHSTTKIVYIQPWEYSKAPFEWQYKFETFADALIVPSNYVSEVFSRGGLNPNKLYIAPNGYEETVFNLEEGGDVSRFGIDKTKFNFIYVGNSQWRKGLDILLNLWPKAFNKADNARLIIKDSPRIYGKSNLLSEIIRLQYNNDSAEIIYIDDELSQIEMADLYKASKVLVHPYRAEGFAMHVQEAMACGCVPIISANGPTDDFIPLDKGLRIPVQPTPINIQDPNIFALKPGDATTLMSTHTFINEPSMEHLFKALKYVYHSHDRDIILKNLQDTSMLNKWEKVINTYESIFFDVISKSTIRR